MPPFNHTVVWSPSVSPMPQSSDNCLSPIGLEQPIHQSFSCTALSLIPPNHWLLYVTHPWILQEETTLTLGESFWLESPRWQGWEGTQRPRELWRDGRANQHRTQTETLLSPKYLSGFCVSSVPCASIKKKKPNIFILCSSKIVPLHCVLAGSIACLGSYLTVGLTKVILSKAPGMISWQRLPDWVSSTQYENM